MYSFTTQDYLEQISGTADGLNSLSHALEIINNTSEQLCYKDFAEVLRAVAFKLHYDSQQARLCLTQQN